MGAPSYICLDYTTTTIAILLRSFRRRSEKTFLSTAVVITEALIPIPSVFATLFRIYLVSLKKSQETLSIALLH